MDPTSAHAKITLESVGGIHDAFPITPHPRDPRKPDSGVYLIAAPLAELSNCAAEPSNCALDLLKLALPGESSEKEREIYRPGKESEGVARRREWARLIAKVFEVDPLRCPCGATMRVVAFILDPTAIRKILQHRPRPEARAHAPPAG